MKSFMFPRFVFIAAMMLAVPTIGGCGSKTEGTYTNTGGMVTLDLKSGGKATFTMMGESIPCAYKVSGDKVNLDCTPKGEKVDFMIHDDGSLTGPSFIGSMKKSK
jgi:phosphohistidine swiveling domain-containing protein